LPYDIVLEELSNILIYDNCLEELTTSLIFPDRIPWILHFYVLVVWTEKWSLAYLTWRVVPKFLRSIHAQ
jgi:hypothetical protein